MKKAERRDKSWVRYLDNPVSMAAYLSDLVEMGDAALLASHLGEIARYRGMTEIAKAAGMTREALYKALRPGSSPRFETVSRVCAALGVRLVVEVISSTDGVSDADVE